VAFLRTPFFCVFFLSLLAGRLLRAGGAATNPEQVLVFSSRRTMLAAAKEHLASPDLGIDCV
jgi:hypothetical protein